MVPEPFEAGKPLFLAGCGKLLGLCRLLGV